MEAGMRSVLTMCVCMVLGMAVIPAAPINEGYEGMINKLFDAISEGKGSEGLDALYRSNPYSDKIQDAVQQVKSSYGSIEGLVGKYRGSTLILKRDVGDRLVYLYYLVTYDREPIKFEFLFYRPGDKWVIQNFSFSDKITDDVRDFAKCGLLERQK